jgi:hypothetical protein
MRPVDGNAIVVADVIALPYDARTQMPIQSVALGIAAKPPVSSTRRRYG